MEDLSSKKIVDLYHKANKNKYDIALKSEYGRDFSKAELTVLACLAVVAREAEYCKMPYLANREDYNKVIKTLILNSLDGMTDNLKKEKEYNEIINSYKNMELYDAYYATSIYKGMLDNFNIYMEPAYKEEIFVNDHLGLQEDTESENSIYIDNTDRKESKLEKIYGSLVLAVGLESEYNYSIDFDKLYKILLLSYTPKESLNKLLGGQKLVDMVKEQEELTSLEGEYASLISILQDDLQIKSYEDNDMIDGYKNETKGLKLFEHYYLYHRPYFNNRIPCLGKVLGEASEHTFTKEEVIVPGRRVIPVLRKK